MVYPIVKFGDPVLEKKAQRVEEFDAPELHQLIEDMFESMQAAKGVGLAAPQIGISRSIAVIDTTVSEEEQGQRLVLINPEVIRREGKQVSEEGCLSVPGFAEPVRRSLRVTVRAQNVKGETFEVTGEGLLARALEHETDHLYGQLYLTHLSPLKRDLIKRRIRKLQKEGEWQ